jgi:hypothetical protein
MKRSQKQENHIAKSVNGTRSAGSGNTPWRKNDIRNDQYSIEAKTTLANSYSLKVAELEQAEYYALLDNRDMLFVVEMGGRNWAIMPFEDWESLVEKSSDGS